MLKYKNVLGLVLLQFSFLCSETAVEDNKKIDTTDSKKSKRYPFFEALRKIFDHRLSRVHKIAKHSQENTFWRDLLEKTTGSIGLYNKGVEVEIKVDISNIITKSGQRVLFQDFNDDTTKTASKRLHHALYRIIRYTFAIAKANLAEQYSKPNHQARWTSESKTLSEIILKNTSINPDELSKISLDIINDLNLSVNLDPDNPCSPDPDHKFHPVWSITDSFDFEGSYKYDDKGNKVGAKLSFNPARLFGKAKLPKGSTPQKTLNEHIDECCEIVSKINQYAFEISEAKSKLGQTTDANATFDLKMNILDKTCEYYTNLAKLLDKNGELPSALGF